ncbi:MAG TPA: heme o synthase [Anaerolineales bacterium]|nr:heme o synthase [Anaerolineales bacterium]
MNIVAKKFRLYWPLIKSLQTGLLLMTGVAGYLSTHAPVHWNDFLPMIPSLFLAISGSTILNMWWDRDIDAKMKRTHKRPTSAGQITANEVLRLGLVISIIGIGWAFYVNFLYGLVVFAGLFCDVMIYSIWLKRRTCWAIVWGGISGAMPVLSGRVLAVGRIDAIGVLLAAAILFWIPTHTLTFSLKFFEDYKNAGIPTFPSTYGNQFTRVAIAASSIIAGLAMSVASIWIGVAEGILALIIVLSAVLLFLAATVVFNPSDQTNLRLYKYASIYMLSTMLLIIPYHI